jgi:hypothetical protein
MSSLNPSRAVYVTAIVSGGGLRKFVVQIARSATTATIKHVQEVVLTRIDSQASEFRAIMAYTTKNGEEWELSESFVVNNRDDDLFLRFVLYPRAQEM